MSYGAIEIQDVGVLVVDETGRLLAPPSPGYALIEGGILTGVEARDRSRSHPRHTHHRFWADLSTTPLGRPFPAGLSPADLAHAHLSAVWAQVGSALAEVILAVPGSASEPELALLLGIARSSGVPVAGLVDAAVAAAASREFPEGRLLHLDLQLHRAVLTEMTAGDEIRRQSVHALNDNGMRALEQAWVRRIAELFVTRTRFDPLHAATSEQALFGSIGVVTERLNREDGFPVTIEAAGRSHTIEITRKEILDSAAPRYEAILRLVGAAASAGSGPVLLSGRVAGLPGLQERLQHELPVEVATLPVEAAGIGACRRREAIRADGEALPFITRLPRTSAVAAGPSRVPGAALPATHVLHEGLAHRISSHPFRIGARIPDDHRGLVLPGLESSHCSLARKLDRILLVVEPGAQVSRGGQRLEGEVEVHAGDVLHLGTADLELRMIRMGEGDGTA